MCTVFSYVKKDIDQTGNIVDKQEYIALFLESAH